MKGQLPERPMFQCQQDSLVILEAKEAANYVRSGHGEPWLTLRCGPGNVLESRPAHVLRGQGGKLSVACADGSTVELDFDEGTARKTTRDGEFVYRGGIEEGNDGRGYMRWK